MAPSKRRAATGRTLGRIKLSSPLTDADLLLLSGLTRHWTPDGPTALVPCAEASPQVAAESLRRILSSVLSPRGIRMHGTATIVLGGRRVGTVSVKHGRVTAHHGLAGLARHRRPVQSDRSEPFDLEVPYDVEPRLEALDQPAEEYVASPEDTTPAPTSPAAEAASVDQTVRATPSTELPGL